MLQLGNEACEKSISLSQMHKKIRAFELGHFICVSVYPWRQVRAFVLKALSPCGWTPASIRFRVSSTRCSASKLRYNKTVGYMGNTQPPPPPAVARSLPPILAGSVFPPRRFFTAAHLCCHFEHVDTRYMHTRLNQHLKMELHHHLSHDKWYLPTTRLSRATYLINTSYFCK